MVLLLEDLPDLVIDKAFSYLTWPHEALSVLVVNVRISNAVRSHSTFADILLESRASIHLPQISQFMRTRVKLPISAKSTIALAFSSDGHTLASTHGDHTVKLINVAASVASETQPADGCVISQFEGHPRTPWTVKFHPTNPNLVASGCLGGQLRLWNTNNQDAVCRTTLPHPVISLSFHPNGNMLAAAAGTMLFLWNFEDNTEPRVILKTEVSLRCVRFLDNGRLLVGVRSRTTETGVTNYIRAARAQLLLYTFDEQKVKQNEMLSNPVVVVRRALLYNDAGLDVSQDTVLTCAEFWRAPKQEGGANNLRAPMSPHGAHDFVGGADNEENLATLEDTERERLGDERVAHLVQVSLALQPPTSSSGGGKGRDIWCSDSSYVSGPPSSHFFIPAGKLMRSSSLEGLWAGSQNGDQQMGTFVTSVKLSPTGEYILLGSSRGNTDQQNENSSKPKGWQHPVAAVWRLGDMKKMSTLVSRTDQDEEDDANVALFHPQPGAGVVYGTKQGQIACALSGEVLSNCGLL